MQDFIYPDTIIMNDCAEMYDTRCAYGLYDTCCEYGLYDTCCEYGLYVHEYGLKFMVLLKFMTVPEVHGT